MKLTSSLWCIGVSSLAAAGLIRAAEPPVAPTGQPGPSLSAPAPPIAWPVPTAEQPAAAPQYHMTTLGGDAAHAAPGDPFACPPPDGPPGMPTGPCVLGYPRLANFPLCLVPPMLGGGPPPYNFVAGLRFPPGQNVTASRVVPTVAIAVSNPGVYFNLALPTQSARVPLDEASFNVLAPLLSEGSFRIGENESPQPQNRVFFNYNYFRDVNRSANRGSDSFSLIRVPLPSVNQVLLQETARVVIRAQIDLNSLGFPITINGRTTAAVLGPATRFTVINVPNPAPGSLPPSFPFPFFSNPPPTPATPPGTRLFVVGQTTQPVLNSGLFQTAGGAIQPNTFIASPTPLIVNQGTAPPYTIDGNSQVQIVGMDGDTAILAVRAKAPREEVHLGTFGFEKTFSSGLGSFGLRVPVYGITNDGSFKEDAIDDMDLGDVSVVLKLALVSDPSNGSVISGGLVATFPTGQSHVAFDGQKIHPTLLQPFLGYLWNTPTFFVHGFSSYVFSIDSRVPDLLLNDIGIGWWLYRTPLGPYRSNAFADRELPGPGNAFDVPVRRSNAFSDAPGDAPFLSGVVPTLEVHANTPIEGRDNPAIRAFDSIVVTGGTHFLLYNQANLGVGVGAPVNGPRAFEWGIFAQLNVNY